MNSKLVVFTKKKNQREISGWLQNDLFSRFWYAAFEKRQTLRISNSISPVNNEFNVLLLTWTEHGPPPSLSCCDELNFNRTSLLLRHGWITEPFPLGWVRLCRSNGHRLPRSQLLPEGSDLRVEHWRREQSHIWTISCERSRRKLLASQSGLRVQGWLGRWEFL